MQPESITFPVAAQCQIHGAVTSHMTAPVEPGFTGAQLFYEGTHQLPCPICNNPSNVLPQIIRFERGQYSKTDSFDDYKNGWNIRFTHCIQHSIMQGSDNEHMNATIYFQMARLEDADRIEIIQSCCAINQDAGDSHSFEEMPLNVENPSAISGLINYQEFRDAAEQYFRLLVGKDGNAIKWGENCFNNYIAGQRMRQDFWAVIHSADGIGAW